ncbi:hypothetical protein D3874_24425 [Oleomonas cavernae]|uniref:Uncharacterized protein n=1 Tax=Oleomonas cavernae TaxID=2320859 RepID=A0A418WIA4_9PROT|nr:hypothetical protein [Oleomonas cavernae]RJF89725.1 hypothetical protein D3874_24425 [Oleomonas cavernae]
MLLRRAIVFAVPATAESRDLLYQFELVSGATEDLFFWSTEKTANVGAAPAFEHEGKLFFVFPWTDDASQVQEALDLKVRVTAFRRSGLRGGSTEIQVHDPGRS